jgi:hypothetical protein
MTSSILTLFQHEADAKYRIVVCITFEFNNGDAYNVDFEQYH